MVITKWIADERIDPGEGPAGPRVEFAIGDVHGFAGALEMMLAGVAHLAAEAGPERCHLTYLGDLIDRGPASARCMALAARTAEDHGVGGVTCLMGNHEQLLRLVLGGRLPETLWFQNGGRVTINSFPELADLPSGIAGDRLRMRLGFEAATGRDLDAFLAGLPGHRRAGNLLFVHAGIDPSVPLADFLALPWYGGLADERHWAWVREPFLLQAEPFTDNGVPLVVVHGHTPELFVKTLTGNDTPHFLRPNGCLNLDGGSYVTGYIVGVQMERGRYRVLAANRE